MRGKCACVWETESVCERVRKWLCLVCLRKIVGDYMCIRAPRCVCHRVHQFRVCVRNSVYAVCLSSIVVVGVYICVDFCVSVFVSKLVYVYAAPEASWGRVFDLCTPLLFDLYHSLWTERYFRLMSEHAPGPCSQVFSGCRVRYPLGSKSGFIWYQCHGSVCEFACCEDCFYYCSWRNNVIVLFGTLKVQSFMLTEVRDCDLLIVVTSSTFLKRKDMLKEKSS